MRPLMRPLTAALARWMAYLPDPIPPSARFPAEFQLLICKSRQSLARRFEFPPASPMRSAKAPPSPAPYARSARRQPPPTSSAPASNCSTFAGSADGNPAAILGPRHKHAPSPLRNVRRQHRTRCCTYRYASTRKKAMTCSGAFPPGPPVAHSKCICIPPSSPSSPRHKQCNAPLNFNLLSHRPTLTVVPAFSASPAQLQTARDERTWPVQFRSACGPDRCCSVQRCNTLYTARRKSSGSPAKTLVAPLSDRPALASIEVPYRHVLKPTD
ncbi:hypothetical protein C8Q78DRAFT_13629 [Trametes maxima]|nr:hypothetical protein C8Q78DRAFT_13629 [Trametes maxima]